MAYRSLADGPACDRRPALTDKPLNIAATLAEFDWRQSIHLHTNLRKHEAKGPVIMARGRGVYVYDVEGREYIEGMAGLWCVSFGFSDQRLISAATKQLNTLQYDHGFAHKTSDVAIQVARFAGHRAGEDGARLLRHQRL